MKGSIVKRKGGYAVAWSTSTRSTAKRKQKWHSGYRTRRDAERALSEIVGSLHGGTYIEPSKQTVAEFATDWLTAIKPTVRPSTHASYSRNLQVHVVPHIGATPLRRLDAGQLNAMYAELLDHGKQTRAYAAAVA